METYMCTIMTTIQKKSSHKRPVEQEHRSQTRQKLPVSPSTPNDLLNIFKEYHEKAPESCAEIARTSVWMALNVVMDHTTFENSLLQHDLSKRQNQNVVPKVWCKFRKFQQGDLAGGGGAHV
jgi:hypothetical protein